MVLSWSPIYDDVVELASIDDSHTLEVTCQVECPACGPQIQRVRPELSCGEMPGAHSKFVDSCIRASQTACDATHLVHPTKLISGGPGDESFAAGLPCVNWYYHALTAVHLLWTRPQLS